MLCGDNDNKFFHLGDKKVKYKKSLGLINLHTAGLPIPPTILGTEKVRLDEYVNAAQKLSSETIHIRLCKSDMIYPHHNYRLVKRINLCKSLQELISEALAEGLRQKLQLDRPNFDQLKLLENAEEISFVSGPLSSHLAVYMAEIGRTCTILN
jgi:hypothetical protein